jgi:HK97 family phage major capsid protein
MQIGTGVANQVVYMPPGGLSQQPYATLMGRPVMPVEYCATLGTVGDIILIDLSQWVLAKKRGGPQAAATAHLYFNTDEQAFRLVFRVDAQPWWASALTPYKGSNTQSCAVTLATRA